MFKNDNNFALPKSGAWPWVNAAFRFAGWVPNVSGHLSFSLIGIKQSLSKVTKYNQGDETGHSRLVIVHQKRPVRDFPINGEIVQFFRPRAAVDFLLIGHTTSANTPHLLDGRLSSTPDSQGALVGWIFAVPAEEREIPNRERMNFLTQVKEKIAAKDYYDNDLANQILSLVRNAHISGVAVLGTRFALFRTGETRIWFEMKEFVGRECHPQAIPPNSSETKLAESLPHHCFYFLKDITHRHYHHDRNSDQLVQLSNLVKPLGTGDHRELDLGWRRATLWGLSRVSLQYRQQNRISGYKQALGVLAYADMFQSSLAGHYRPENVSELCSPHGELAVYDFRHIKDSIQAMESVATWKLTGRVQFMATLFGIMLSCFALWASSVQMRPALCKSLAIAEEKCPSKIGEQSLNVVQWVALHPLLFSIFSMLLAISVWFFLMNRATVIPGSERLKKFSNRLVQAIGASLATKVKSDYAGWTASLLLITIMLCGVAFAVRRIVTVMLNN